MAYSETLKINRAVAASFDGTGQNTTPLLLAEGDTVYWSIGSGYTGNFQIQSAAPGTSTFIPTPFNGLSDIANGNVSGSFTAPARCLFRIATTTGAGAATVQILK